MSDYGCLGFSLEHPQRVGIEFTGSQLFGHPKPWHSNSSVSEDISIYSNLKERIYSYVQTASVSNMIKILCILLGQNLHPTPFVAPPGSPSTLSFYTFPSWQESFIKPCFIYYVPAQGFLRFPFALNKNCKQ